jgi:hypothetical protein
VISFCIYQNSDRTEYINIRCIAARGDGCAPAPFFAFQIEYSRGEVIKAVLFDFGGVIAEEGFYLGSRAVAERTTSIPMPFQDRRRHHPRNRICDRKGR